MKFQKIKEEATKAFIRIKHKLLDLKDRVVKNVQERLNAARDHDAPKSKFSFNYKPLLTWLQARLGRVKESQWAQNASQITTEDILRHHQKWKTFLAIGAAAATGHLISMVTGNLLINSRGVTPPSFVQPGRPPAPRKELTAYKEIYERPIFDHESFVPQYGGPGSGELDCSAAEPTRLPLELVGTIVLDKEELSVASIRDKSGNLVDAYQKNDPVGNHPVTVQKVEHLKVCLLNQSGKLEFIEIKELNGIKISTATTKPTTGTGISQEDDNNYAISAKWKDEQIGNIGEIVTQARAIPHFDNGQITGFRIINIKRGGIFDQLGIKEGDIVEEVNDIPLSNQGQALGLFNQLKDMNEGTITIVINRNGTQMMKNYNLKQ